MDGSPTEQLELDPVAESHRRKTEGMARAKASTSPTDWTHALNVLRYLASLNDPATGLPKPFTADDLHDHGIALGNTMGTLFAEAHGCRLIEPAEVGGDRLMRPSRRPELHHHPLTVWRGVRT